MRRDFLRVYQPLREAVSRGNELTGAIMLENNIKARQDVCEYRGSEHRAEIADAQGFRVGDRLLDI
jgi:hypothetical protein